jgi:lysophospholipase L1-like esterase
MIPASYPHFGQILNPFTTNSTILFDADFTQLNTLPAGFVTEGGAWVLDANGLTSPATGGYTSRAKWAKYTCLDRCELKVRVTINQPNTVFQIFREWDLAGSIAEVNTEKKLATIYQLWGRENSALPQPAFVQHLVHGVSPSNTYNLILRRLGGQIKFSIQLEGGFEHIIQLPENYYPFAGAMWGYPGIMFTKGSVTIKRFTVTARVPQNPRLLILGDSYVDGNTTRDNVGGYETRYAAGIYRNLLDNCILAGKGGEDSTTIIPRLDVDLDLFNPAYVLIAIGYNDTSYSTWQTNLNTIIGRVLAKGAIPILTTYAPRADRQTQINQQNSQVRNVLSAQYDYLDINAAVSNDGTTWKSGNVLSDQVHPTALGHANILARVPIDIPQVLNS